MDSKKLNQLLVGFLITIMLVLNVPGVYGQITSDKWDLNRCIEYALDKNLSVNQSRLKLSSGEVDLMQSKSLRLPNLNASASQNLTNSRTGNGDAWDMSYDGSFSVTTGVTLYNGGIIGNDIQRSNKALELAALNLEQAQNSIILLVTQAYLNVLYAKENYDYYNQVVAASERQAERARALQKAGSLARRDVADVEAQLASDKYALVNALNNLTLQTTTLKQILEIPVEDTFNVFFPTDGLKESLDMLPSRTVAFESALNFRPEVKSSTVQEEMARIDLKSAQAGYLPVVGLSGSMGTSYTDKLTTTYGTQMSDNFMQRVGLTVSIPIFNRNATKANVSRSKINLELAGLTVANTRNKLLQEVEKVYEDTHAAQQRFDAAQAQKSASAESYRLAEEQYNIGMLNAFELLQIKNNYLNATKELIQARYTTVLYRKILDFYMGVPIVLNY